MTIKCCYGCTERTVTCHSTCEKYLGEVAENKAKKDVIRKAKEQTNVADNYICDNKSKHLKR